MAPTANPPSTPRAAQLAVFFWWIATIAFFVTLAIVLVAPVRSSEVPVFFIQLGEYFFAFAGTASALIGFVTSSGRAKAACGLIIVIVLVGFGWIWATDKVSGYRTVYYIVHMVLLLAASALLLTHSPRSHEPTL